MWKCKCGEINPDSSSFCQSCGNNKSTSEFNGQKHHNQQEQRSIQLEKLARERVQQQHASKMKNLTNMNLDGYYEYKVLSLSDESGFFKKDSGKVDIISMTRILNELGIEGWHLVMAYSNQLGENALSGGIGRAMFGVNSTVDENILIFERFIKVK